jgi:hypothetical protein
MPSPDLPPVKPHLDLLLDTALRTGGETERFDFKELLNLALDEHKVRLVRAVGAFANTDEGGFILIGISDDRRVVGVASAIAEAYDQTRVHAIIAQYLAPPPAIQVRHHEYQGQKVIAGTFLFRSKAAKSGVLEAESDVRALCDTLVKRRASAFLDLIQRGAIGIPMGSTRADLFISGTDIRSRADHVWPTSGKAKPSVEVGFTPARELSLTPDQMRKLIPAACIPVEHGFPFCDVRGYDVHRPVSWGWYGRIPVADVAAETPEPSYLWMFSRTGAFLHREHLWEDSEGSVIPGGVGLFHLVGNAILIVRFLRSVASKLSLDEALQFRVFIAANNVLGRYLEDEKRNWLSPFRKAAVDPTISASIEVGLSAVITSPYEIVIKLVDEMSWQFGRDDLKRQNIEESIRRARDVLGVEYRLEESAGG